MKSGDPAASGHPVNEEGEEEGQGAHLGEVCTMAAGRDRGFLGGGVQGDQAKENGKN